MRWGRAYFAVQALAGAVWWVAVFASPTVRQLTLGELDPVVVALVDVPLFVGASAAAAFGVRPAAYVSTGWTGFVTLALAVYATVTTEAGWGVLVMGAATAGSVVALSLMVFGRVPTAWIARGPFSFRPASIRPTASSTHVVSAHVVSAHVVSAHVVSTFGQIVVFWGLFLTVIPAAITIVEQRWGVSLPFAPAVGPLGVVLLVLASALGLSSAAAQAPQRPGVSATNSSRASKVLCGCSRCGRWPAFSMITKVEFGTAEATARP
ncbi:isoprenylcysteine carboxylmethyltransferase family protein [Subtercola sp. RTI3]|uniref:isoprenylcysteine carboxylmethyltransferase family protein n=1 Tax=Subtercola sp. RTI3 TaxID=3048639 RepID=UPI002B224304|nr:isoprenylcysteine carboxylmethyltransferase family protein [Subtercola sp. RTI3]MEA9985837.1 isoprenylcysteine carboxylmethyltransferase family protein [Subtercola sp. RTI3]